ncbi:MAG TPA: hypothetical protein VK575_11685, partial [Gemmatimonadaceae bacterium]|nr:hypothetical protein [Gemmatimonadaceae bacterium]
AEGELAEPSSLEKILRVQTAAVSRADDLHLAIAGLEELAADGKKEEMLRELQNIVMKFTRSRGTPVPV